ncbi:MAG: DMT family transporter [Betaproteobacteria bacterium]
MHAVPLPAHVRIAKVLFWAIPLLWIVNSVIARRAPGVITPHVLALGRWMLAGVLLGWLARRELWQQRRELRLHAGRYLALGACGMWICGAAVYFAGQSTSMMNISLIYAASPVMITIGSVLWLGEPSSARQALGVVAALAGVVHVVVQGEWLRLSTLEFVPGDLWVVAAAAAWAAYSLLQKRWPSALGSTAQLAAMCAGGVVVLLPFAVWELTHGEPVLGTQALWLVGVAALIPGIGSYWIYGWTQKILGAGPVAMTMYLGPLYAAVVAWLLLDEALGLHHLVGGALILSGVGLVMAGKKAAARAR